MLIYGVLLGVVLMGIYVQLTNQTHVWPLLGLIVACGVLANFLGKKMRKEVWFGKPIK